MPIPRQIIERLVPQDNVVASKRPIDREGLRVELEAHRSELRPFFKPDGLWYACGSDWLRWFSVEMPHLFERYEYLYLLDLDKSRMKLIQTEAQLIELHAAYSSQRGEFTLIDWPRIARDYGGFELCPMHWNHFEDMDWLLHWNVASGCIWDIDVIKNISRAEW